MLKYETKFFKIDIRLTVEESNATLSQIVFKNNIALALGTFLAFKLINILI